MQPKNNIPILSRSGLQLAKTGDNSLSLINHLIEEGNPEHWYKKAVKAKEEESWEEAFYFISKAIKLNKIESIYWVQNSFISIKLDKAEIAANSLIQALEHRQNLKALKSYLTLDEWSKLKSYFQEIKIAESNHQITLIKAFLELVFNNPKASLTILNSIDRAWFHNNFSFFDIRFSANYDLRKFDAAKKDAEELNRVNSKHTKTFNHLGLINHEFKDYGLAIKNFNKALEINPNCFNSYYNRGRSNFATGNFICANLDFTKAIEIQPVEPWSYIMRAKTKFKLNEKNEAIQDIQTLLKFECPKDISFFLRGTAKASLSDYSGAILDYGKAIEANSNDEKSYFKRGQVFFKLNDFQKAIEDFDYCLYLNPKNSDAVSLKEKAYKELEKLQNLNEV